MMALMWNVVLIISGFAYLQLSSFAENVNVMSISADETDPSEGVAVNCGKEPITVTWTPKVLQPSGSVNVTIKYYLPHYLSSGIFNVSLYFHGEDTPFLGYADRFDCDTLKGHTGRFSCPFSKKP
ncbi:uncharacterized protein LOC131955729 [Physella acuta]|uniref:uncharacterized protein LOC131955729 n=1 Tax=Physella acuta TaxID=109671 RepID=UPI0027DB4FE1|nr:uncharacterized protein LOC131955729 [Physella acuta]